METSNEVIKIQCLCPVEVEQTARQSSASNSVNCENGYVPQMTRRMLCICPPSFFIMVHTRTETNQDR